MKTLSKQNTETQLDFDLSSFQTSNNFSKKNSVIDTNTNTYTNSNNTSKHCTNSKIKQNKHKHNFFSNFATFDNITNHHNKSHSKYLQCNNTINPLIQNNSINKENKSFSQIKKRIKSKSKTKEMINQNLFHLKPSSLAIKTDSNSLNISNNSKKKISKEKYKKDKMVEKSLKKSSTGKILNISIKKYKNSNALRKLGSPGLTKFIIKTNINSPLDSNRKQKQIIKLKKELENKKDEIINLKRRISEQDKYIYDLENKIKSIRNNKQEEDEEYEQYSKKMILRNIKVLTNENEELHKQIKEYKEKEIKIMRALYYINKKGISIDTFLDCNTEDKK
jgi:hypothetical protein